MGKQFEAALVFSLVVALSFGVFGSSAQAGTRHHSQGILIRIEDQQWTDSKRHRSIPVKLYIPSLTKSSSPCPILVFSHGLGGSREAAAYLGEFLAQKGYLCLHLQHPGSDTAVVKSAMQAGRENFRATLGAAANFENLVLRVGDVSFAIDELERRNKSDPFLRNRLDLSRIAVAGHSFGAGTMLAVCGQNYGFKGQMRNAVDSRVKAAIYLSAPVNLRGRSLADVYGQIKVPGLLMTGTNDSSPIGSTSPAERRQPFDGISAPHQYFVNYIGGDHAIFGGRSFRATRPEDEAFHKSINDVCWAFLDAYIKDDKRSRAWLDGSGVKKYLEDTATFERK